MDGKSNNHRKTISLNVSECWPDHTANNHRIDHVCRSGKPDRTHHVPGLTIIWVAALVYGLVTGFDWINGLLFLIHDNA